MNSIYFIAEAGVNHNGSIEIAKRLILSAKKSGASAIKFQTYVTEELVTPFAKQAQYQVLNTEEQSQYQMLKSLELSFDEFRELKNYSDLIEIDFLSTPFDFKSADFLINELSMRTIKLSSGDLTNLPLLFFISKHQVRMILSTGMSNEEELKEALITIAFGLGGNNIFDLKDANNFFETKEAQSLLKKFVTIMHCTSEYPTPVEHVSLKSIDYLKQKTNLEVGLSDHSKGILVPVIAASRGVNIIEKHFTLDKTFYGPDHKASIDPYELKTLMEMLKKIPILLGEENKIITKQEFETKNIVQKSLVAKQIIRKGDLFTFENIAIKRPGSGMKPILYWSLMDKRASKDYSINELIQEEVHCNE